MSKLERRLLWLLLGANLLAAIIVCCLLKWTPHRYRYFVVAVPFLAVTIAWAAASLRTVWLRRTAMGLIWLLSLNTVYRSLWETRSTALVAYKAPDASGALQVVVSYEKALAALPIKAGPVKALQAAEEREADIFVVANLNQEVAGFVPLTLLESQRKHALRLLILRDVLDSGFLSIYKSLDSQTDRLQNTLRLREQEKGLGSRYGNVDTVWLKSLVSSRQAVYVGSRCPHHYGAWIAAEHLADSVLIKNGIYSDGWLG